MFLCYLKICDTLKIGIAADSLKVKASVKCIVFETELGSPSQLPSKRHLDLYSPQMVVIYKYTNWKWLN